MKKHYFIGSGDYSQEIRKWSNFYKKINFANFVDEKIRLNKFINKFKILDFKIFLKKKKY